MSKSKKNYPEIDDIREDIDSLKYNVVELTKHIKADGQETLEEAKETASEKLKRLSDSGKRQLKNMEGRVKEKPAQSMAIAFAAGLALSAMMKR